MASRPKHVLQRTSHSSDTAVQGSYVCSCPSEQEHAGSQHVRLSAGSHGSGGAQCQHKWYSGLRDLFSSTLHECKVGVSYVLPRVCFSMICTAHLQRNSEGKSFGLAVVLTRSDRSCVSKATHITSRTTDALRVGGSLHPRMVPTGTIAVRLVSRDFEADTRHGEDGGLVKTEADFRGRDFEKQFACSFKEEPVREGVFGKVRVENIQPSGIAHTLFEFNLTKGKREPEPSPGEIKDCERWSLLAVTELASMLHITDDDNWVNLAKRLGFTDHEVKTNLALVPDPFQELLVAYQCRGGSPEEFVQALYEVARQLSVDESSSCGEGLSPLRSVSHQSSLSSQNSWGSVGRHSCGDDDEDDAFEPSTVSSIPLTVPIQILPGQTICTSLPLTPPPTPRKRKRSLSDTGSISPKKGRCLFKDDVTVCGSRTAPSVFVFPDVAPQYDPDDVAYRESREELPSSVLWQVSAMVHQKWKSLGRTMDVPETELMCIEHANNDLRECAYQTLLKWRDMFPQRGCYGVLYGALCDCSLKSVAQKYCIKK